MLSSNDSMWFRSCLLLPGDASFGLLAILLR
jgi:hypothetical protein